MVVTSTRAGYRPPLDPENKYPKWRDKKYAVRARERELKGFKIKRDKDGSGFSMMIHKKIKGFEEGTDMSKDHVNEMTRKSDVPKIRKHYYGKSERQAKKGFTDDKSLWKIDRANNILAGLRGRKKTGKLSGYKHNVWNRNTTTEEVEQLDEALRKSAPDSHGNIRWSDGRVQSSAEHGADIAKRAKAAIRRIHHKHSARFEREHPEQRLRKEELDEAEGIKTVSTKGYHGSKPMKPKYRPTTKGFINWKGGQPEGDADKEVLAWHKSEAAKTGKVVQLRYRGPRHKVGEPWSGVGPQQAHTTKGKGTGAAIYYKDKWELGGRQRAKHRGWNEDYEMEDGEYEVIYENELNERLSREEYDMNEDEEVQGPDVSDLVMNSIEQRPLEFQQTFADLMQQRIEDAVAEKKLEIASMFVDPSQYEVGDEPEAEEQEIEDEEGEVEEEPEVQEEE